MNKVALDTNVLIYLHDINNSPKRQVAADILSENMPIISSQVISEYLNVCNKRLKMSKEDSLESLMGWLPFCELSAVNVNVFSTSLRLIKKYKFQMFDSIVVASALEAGCQILYSEDMHHNLFVEKQLKIINPFSFS